MNGENKFFSQIAIKENIQLEKGMGGIDKIVSKFIETEILSTSVVDTASAISKDGQYISGKKVVLEIRIKQKIMYSTGDSEENLHVIESECIHVDYIAVPYKIEGTEIDVFVKKNRFKVDLIVEDVYVYPIDKRNLYKNIFMTAVLVILPTYEICYCVYRKEKKSNIYFMYENGENRRKALQSGNNIRGKKLKWTSDGKSVMFISNKDGIENLFVIDSNSSSVSSLIKGNIRYIKYFHLNRKGNLVIFSGGRKGEENIYLLDIITLKYKNVTKDILGIRNFNPKFSPDGSKIAFLRNISGITNIWVISLKNYSLNKITNCGYVKNFQWWQKGTSIIYNHGNSMKKDTISCLDLNTLLEKDLIHYKYFESLRKLRISPNERYICYVINDKFKDNIFLYDFKLKKMKRLTNNKNGVKIYDLIWKIDSNKIYYSQREQMGCSIRSIDLIDLKKQHLVTYKNAYNIKMTYRPRIS